MLVLARVLPLTYIRSDIPWGSVTHPICPMYCISLADTHEPVQSFPMTTTPYLHLLPRILAPLTLCYEFLFYCSRRLSCFPTLQLPSNTSAFPRDEQGALTSTRCDAQECQSPLRKGAAPWAHALPVILLPPPRALFPLDPAPESGRIP